MQKITLQDYSNELKNAGLKLTYPRQRIFSLFQKTTKPLSAQEVSLLLLDIHFVSVYRNLETLSKVGILVKLPYGFKYRYELSDKFLPHHHHATCQSCSASFKLNSQKIEFLIEEASIVAGVYPVSHHIEVIGICLNCKKSQTNAY
jgi:Fe2+ or Zn2+ uptake regulation protein